MLKDKIIKFYYSDLYLGYVCDGKYEQVRLLGEKLRMSFTGQHYVTEKNKRLFDYIKKSNLNLSGTIRLVKGSCKVRK